jgi:hypothetical protein
MVAWVAVASGCASTPPPASDPPPILVVIAPAPPAPSGSIAVPVRTLSKDELATDWTGTWEGDSGHRFSHKLHVEQSGKDKRDVEGWFEFTLTQAPDSSRLRERVGESGREYVRGRYDPTTRELTLRGYRVDAPGFLATDEYRIQINPGGRGFEGKTRGNSYRWDCTIRGRSTRY